MKLYICYRGSEVWKGCLLVFAISRERAIGLYYKTEGCQPYKTEEIDIKKGIIYDD